VGKRDGVTGETGRRFGVWAYRGLQGLVILLRPPGEEQDPSKDADPHRSADTFPLARRSANTFPPPSFPLAFYLGTGDAPVHTNLKAEGDKLAN
jgi:hypothetical protein